MNKPEEMLKDKLKMTPDGAIKKITVKIPIREVVRFIKKLFK